MIACDACDAFNSSKASVCIECGEPLAVGDALRPGQDSAAPPDTTPRDTAPPDTAPPDTTPLGGAASRGASRASIEPPPLHQTQGNDGAPPPLPGKRTSGSRSSKRATTRPKTSGSRRSRDPEDVERSRQRQEFGRIKSIVFTVRSVYWSGIVFAAVQLLLYHLILQPVFTDLELTTYSVVVGIISWGQLALLIAGARLIMRQPYVWTLIGAGYWLLATGQAFWVASLADWALLQDTRVVAYLTMMVFMLFAFLFAVGQAKRVQRLMDANPDLQLQRKRLDPEARSVGGIAEEAAVRRDMERKRSHAMQLRLVVAAVGVLVLGGGGVWAMTRPPAPQSAAAKFAEHWGAEDFQSVYKLCVGGESGRVAGSLREDLQQRGWHRDAPVLGEVAVVGAAEHATSRFPCASGELVVQWQLRDVGWRIVSSSLPELVVGKVDDGVATFRAAWASSGMAPLLAMIRPESFKIARGVTSILKRREWLETRPALGDVDVGDLRARGKVRVRFELQSKELSVTLQYWHPEWKIAGFGLR